MNCNDCDRLSECRASGKCADCTTPDEEEWGMVVFMPIGECERGEAE